MGRMLIVVRRADPVLGVIECLCIDGIHTGFDSASVNGYVCAPDTHSSNSSADLGRAVIVLS